MKQLVKGLLIVPAMLLIFGLSAITYAEDGGSSGGSGSSGSGSSGSGDSSQSGGSGDNTSTDTSVGSNSTEVEHVRTRLEQRLQNHKESEDSQISKDRSGDSEDKISTEANDILSQLFKEIGHHHTEAQRQQNCQAAEHGLETKLTNLQTNSQAMLDRINTVLTKVLAYQKDQNLNPTGLSDLLSTATTDQTNATSAVASLQALSVNLDCTSNTVPTTVASFKAAGQDARQALQTYRKAVKAIIVSLIEASQTTGGTQ